MSEHGKTGSMYASEAERQYFEELDRRHREAAYGTIGGVPGLPTVTDAMIEAGWEAAKEYTLSLSPDPESFKGGQFLAALFLAMFKAMMNPPSP